jgi:hypothetical protein
MIADIFQEHLLEERNSITRGMGRFAFIGFGVEGFKHAYVAGNLYKLPIEQHILAVSISDRVYGKLGVYAFQLDYRKWDDPKFRFLTKM